MSTSRPLYYPEGQRRVAKMEMMGQSRQTLHYSREGPTWGDTRVKVEQCPGLNQGNRHCRGTWVQDLRSSEVGTKERLGVYEKLPSEQWV